MKRLCENIKTVADNIKLRLGYGQVGNQEIPNYLYGSPLNASVTGWVLVFSEPDCQS